MDINDLVVPAGGGSIWEMAPGRSAALKGKSTGSEAGRVLFLYTPGNAGSFFEEAAHQNRKMSSMSASEIAETFKRHGWEVVGPPPF